MTHVPTTEEPLNHEADPGSADANRERQLTPAERRLLRELLRGDLPALIRLAVSLALVAIVVLVPGLQTTFLLVLAFGVVLLQIVPSSIALWRSIAIVLDLRAGQAAIHEGTLEKVGRTTSRYLYDAVLDGRKLRLIPAVAQKVEIDRRYRVHYALRSRIAFEAEPARGKVKRRAVK